MSFFDIFKPTVNTIHTEYVKKLIERGAKTQMDKAGFLEQEIVKFKNSPYYKQVVTAYNYYEGKHDILRKKRQLIDKDGARTDLPYLPNNRIVDNQYANAVAKKVNYLTGKPFTITSNSDEYNEKLKKYLNRQFMRTFASVVTDSVNCGIGYLMPYYDTEGNLRWKHLRTWEVIPFWKDEQHTELDAFGRLYTVQGYEGFEERVWEKFDYYTKEGLIEHYVLDGNVLIPDVEHPNEPYFQVVMSEMEKEETFNGSWQKLPLIPFKFNASEQPLLNRCKSIQDAINEITSAFMDNMQEDTRTSLLVLKNYDGMETEGLRHKILSAGIIKVTTVDGVAGGVDTLKIEVNSENYKALLSILKEALIENCKSYSVRDNRLTSDANTVHIQSMFADVDIEADVQEIEYQAAFEDIEYFIDTDLSLKGEGDYFDEEMKIHFNRNLLINESQLTQNLIACFNAGLLSRETALTKLTYCENPAREVEKIKADMEAELDYNTFPTANKQPSLVAGTQSQAMTPKTAENGK